MRNTLVALLTFALLQSLCGQIKYDSIVRSDKIPFNGMGSFFSNTTHRPYVMHYKDGKLLKITGKLAKQSNKNATLDYVQDNVYRMKNYYNQSHSTTIDTIFFYQNKFIISNNQYSFSPNDTIGRFIVYCTLDNNQLEGKIYSITKGFSVLQNFTKVDMKLDKFDLVYHFIIFQKGKYLDKRVLKNLHQFSSSDHPVDDYDLGKKKFNFYNIPLLIIW